MTFCSNLFPFLDSFILEEYEKAISRVPKWKIDYVKKNLKYMIGKEDKELMKTVVKKKKTAFQKKDKAIVKAKRQMTKR